MMFDAWFGIEEMSSLYLRFSSMLKPACAIRLRYELTDSWYSAFSGATTPKRRGWPISSGPAYCTVDPGWNRPVMAATADRTTLVPSGNRLQAYGRRSTNHFSEG